MHLLAAEIKNLSCSTFGALTGTTEKEATTRHRYATAEREAAASATDSSFAACTERLWFEYDELKELRIRHLLRSVTERHEEIATYGARRFENPDAADLGHDRYIG